MMEKIFNPCQHFGPVLHEKITYEAGNPLNEGDLLLEVNGQTVAGLTLYDLNTIIAAADDPIKLKSVQEGLGISKELRRYLTLRTEKGSVDNDLQNMIRDNLYLRTLSGIQNSPNWKNTKIYLQKLFKTLFIPV